MAFSYPSTAVLDAAAHGSGPGTTSLPQILGSDGMEVVAFAQDVLGKVERVNELIQEISHLKQQIEEVWEGDGQRSASRQLAGTLEQASNASQNLGQLATSVGQSGQAMSQVESSFSSIVQAMTPIVAALMSNPFTQAQGTATAQATSASLSTFLGTIGKVLDAIGLGDIGKIFSSAGAVAGDIDKLFSATGTPEEKLTAVGDLFTHGKELFGAIDGAFGGGEEAPAEGGAPAPVAPQTLPSMPTMPDPAAQQSLSGLYAPTQTGYGTPTGFGPTGFDQSGFNSSTGMFGGPGLSQANSWIPMDPISQQGLEAVSNQPPGAAAGDLGGLTGEQGQGGGESGAEGGDDRAGHIVASHGDTKIEMDLPTDEQGNIKEGSYTVDFIGTKEDVVIHVDHDTEKASRA